MDGRFSQEKYRHSPLPFPIISSNYIPHQQWQSKPGWKMSFSTCTQVPPYLIPLIRSILHQWPTREAILHPQPPILLTPTRNSLRIRQHLLHVIADYSCMDSPQDILRRAIMGVLERDVLSQCGGLLEEEVKHDIEDCLYTPTGTLYYMTRIDVFTSRDPWAAIVQAYLIVDNIVITRLNMHNNPVPLNQLFESY